MIMSFEFEDVETDCLLAAVNYLEVIEESQPPPSPESLDTAQARAKRGQQGHAGIGTPELERRGTVEGRGPLPRAYSWYYKCTHVPLLY